MPLHRNSTMIGQSSSQWLQRLLAYLILMFPGVLWAQGHTLPVSSVPLAQDTVDFGSVAVDRSELDLVILKNTSRQVQIFRLMVVNRTGLKDAFYLANPQDSVLVLQPGRQYVVLVGFTPRQEQHYLGAVRVKVISDTAQWMFSIYLVGEGRAQHPALEHISYPQVVFVGTTPVGTTVQSSFTIANNLPVDRYFYLFLDTAASAFSLSFQDSTLRALEQRTFTITFSPATAGYHKTYLYFRVARSPDWGRIVVFGEATVPETPPPLPLVYTPIVDFGATFLRQGKDTTLVVVNRTDVEQFLTSITIDRPVFRMLQPLPDTVWLPPHDTLRIQMRFTPTTPGFVEGNFVFLLKDRRQYRIRLVGEGLAPQATFTIGSSDIGAYSGDTIAVPIWMLMDPEAQKILRAIENPRLILYLHWDATLLWSPDTMAKIERRGQREYGTFVIPLASMQPQLQGLDTVTAIPFVVCLGAALGTLIEIDSAWIENQQHEPVLMAEHTEPGYVELRGVWYRNNLPRLINPFAAPFTVRIDPSPLRDRSVVTIEGNVQADSVHVALYFLTGEPLMDLLLPVHHSPIHFTLDRFWFPTAGAYLLVCQYSWFSLSRLLIVE